jgi:hypothetical protein
MEIFLVEEKRKKNVFQFPRKVMFKVLNKHGEIMIKRWNRKQIMLEVILIGDVLELIFYGEQQESMTWSRDLAGLWSLSHAHFLG